ncbi:MAG: GIY-YIG nuclease family protein [Atopobiaceae bacterium]|jgi:hypothetical protein|nr:GIY-YIG nuclease family protein [Atopobiaceae bacterium]MCI1498037.1 GIY-YIG nuclease family protein [Atopobiaceae bacterium]MCI1539762.1 GIY-YIG nuclease family protein [Atopobiaceae bacterium]
MSKSKEMRLGTSIHLTFRSIDGSIPSAASLVLPADERRGIYLYEFTDGTAYVGRSGDMARRLSDHRHDYRHDPHQPDIRQAHFAPVSNDVSDAQLDEIETEAIHWAESHGFDLVNKLKVDRPGGLSDVEVILDDGASPLLPWDRSKRTDMLEPAKLPTPTRSQEQRYHRFVSTSAVSSLTDDIGRYVAETIPEFARLAGTRWSITAFPPRTRKPYDDAACATCVTCGTLETLVIWTNGTDIYGRINCKRPEGDKKFKPFYPFLLGHQGYTAAKGVVSYTFRNKSAFERMLNNKRLLDWCYRLNVEMMRKGTNPQARWTNPSLTIDVMDAATKRYNTQ